jgi:hypothetical protein
VLPRRTDPLIDAVAPAFVAETMARIRAGIEAMVPTLPTHSHYLQNMMRQSAR